MDRAHQPKEVFADAGGGDPGVIGWKDGDWKGNCFLDSEIAAVTKSTACPSKPSREIAMKVQGPDETKDFWFRSDRHPEVTHGRIGLRHMYSRSARYKDFRVS